MPEDGDEGENAAAGKSAAKKGHYWSHPERKEILWRSFEIRARSREKTFEMIARDFLKRQAKSITDKVSNIQSLDSITPENILDVKKETKRYVDTFTPWYTDAYLRAFAAGTESTKGRIFDDANFKADPKPTSWVAHMTEERKQVLKKMIFDSGTKVNKTALEKIESMLITANENNWTVNEFANNLSEKVFDLVDWKAMMWARTESVKTDSLGQLDSYHDVEFVDKKGWMASFVPLTRDAHAEADGQEVLLDDNFNVGGESMSFPGDPKGSAGNVVNCLCSIYPVVGQL
jgi:hypothetical protein